MSEFSKIIKPIIIGLLLYATLPLLIHLYAAYAFQKVLNALITSGSIINPTNNIITAMGLEYEIYKDFDSFISILRADPVNLLAKIYTNPLKLVSLIFANIFELGFLGLATQQISATGDVVALFYYLGITAGLILINFIPLILAFSKYGYEGGLETNLSRLLSGIFIYFPISGMALYLVSLLNPLTNQQIIMAMINAATWVIFWFYMPKRIKGGAIV